MNVDTLYCRRISIYDAETEELRRKITRNQPRYIGAFTFSHDGKTLALADNGETDYNMDFSYNVYRVALYDTATGDLRRMRRPPPTA